MTKEKKPKKGVEKKSPPKKVSKKPPALRSGFKRGSGGGSEFIMFDSLGKSLYGTFVKKVPTTKKHSADLLKFKNEKGEPVSCFTSKNLDDQFEELKVKAGDLVMITLIEVINLKGGRTFKSFDVQHKRKGK